MKFSLASLFIVLIVGCAVQGHLSTPSGKPETTVHGSIKEVQNACLAWLLSHDYVVGSQTDTKDVVLAGDKDVTSGWYKTFPGNSTIDRLFFNFLQKDSLTITIYATKTETAQRAQTTGGSTSSFSSLNSQEDYEELQAALTEIAQSIASKANTK